VEEGLSMAEPSIGYAKALKAMNSLQNVAGKLMRLQAEDGEYEEQKVQLRRI
jgi:hypothetical protein